MLCQTKGMSICPHTFGCPLFVWMPPVCLDATICLGAPPVCLNAPICLGSHLYVWMPHMFGHPHVCTPHMFGCPLYIWVPPMFGYPSVWLDAPICLDTSRMFGCHQMHGTIQRYQGHPNIWGCQNIQGHPNVGGAYGHPSV